MDEKQAIVCLKQGDWNGLEVLVRAYQLQALHAAYLIVQDHDLAQDIVQEAFLTISQKIAQFDATRPFRPWFLRSVVNASIKAAKRQSRFISLNGDDPEEHAKLVEWLADPNAHLEDFVETNETRRAVRKALLKLTPKQRAVLVMRFYLGMTNQEITNEMGSSVTAVKWSLHAARDRLRKLLHPFRNETQPFPMDEQE
jgi:RNA polymerase sigma-70 factor (ECF subfamily)